MFGVILDVTVPFSEDLNNKVLSDLTSQIVTITGTATVEAFDYLTKKLVGPQALVCLRSRILDLNGEYLTNVVSQRA